MNACGFHYVSMISETFVWQFPVFQLTKWHHFIGACHSKCICEGPFHCRQGYVEFASTKDATEALKKSQNLIIGIRRLNVQFASSTSIIPHQERAKLLVSTWVVTCVVPRVILWTLGCTDYTLVNNYTKGHRNTRWKMEFSGHMKFPFLCSF